MRYCSACGHGNEDGARFCFVCGQAVPVAATPVYDNPVPATPVDTPPVAVQPEQANISRLAIAGALLGVIGFIEATIALVFPYEGGGFAALCVLVGLPLSIIGLNRSPKTRTAFVGVVSNGVTLWTVACGFLLLFVGFLGGNSLEQYTIVEDGRFVVGVDVAPGVYVSAGQYYPSLGSCEFARLRIDGNVIDSSSVGVQRVVVTISESDGAFSTRNCGHWYPLR